MREIEGYDRWNFGGIWPNTSFWESEAQLLDQFKSNDFKSIVTVTYS